MSKWISMMKELPTLGKLIEIHDCYANVPYFIGTVEKLKDECLQEGFRYVYRYESGLLAGNLTERDEWRHIIDEPPKPEPENTSVYI